MYRFLPGQGLSAPDSHFIQGATAYTVMVYVLLKISRRGNGTALPPEISFQRLNFKHLQ